MIAMKLYCVQQVLMDKNVLVAYVEQVYVQLFISKSDRYASSLNVRCQR